MDSGCFWVVGELGASAVAEMSCREHRGCLPEECRCWRRRRASSTGFLWLGKKPKRYLLASRIASVMPLMQVLCSLTSVASATSVIAVRLHWPGAAGLQLLTFVSLFLEEYLFVK